ncbi:MAG TPA: M14 family metallopeptidase, partial [Gemmatimonadales bacterium]|nr:M14 family metallopeptidase [Gemmatimonadales bacterium]
GTLAVSTEGRRIPYVLAGRPLPFSPGGAHRSGKPIVYLQANIHGGEVEGKEAAQMLLRDLTQGRLRPLLDSLILIVVPIFNADGNDRLRPVAENRPGQNGPSIVGQNPNGQGLNLNRDYVKLEAPETRGAVRLIRSWDPDALIDLHTTNGSYHGYVLTYSPSLNPNTNRATEYVRNRLLPAVRDRMARRHRQQTFSYGNFRSQDPDSLVLGWETYDARPRFGTNWMGVRGRLGILSEGYSNADFKTRIQATYNFVHEVLSLVAEQTSIIKALVRATDDQRPDSVAVRSTLAPPTQQVVVAELTRSAGEGTGGFARRQRTGVYRSIRMPVFDRFQGVRKEAMPDAYLLPARLRSIVELLRAQGIAVDSITHEARLTVHEFAVDSLITAPVFEGHRPLQAEGRWSSQSTDTIAVPGWYLVRTDQPLGVLAAYLLEPASEDGVVTWNLLDREMKPRMPYPILRIFSTPNLRVIAVP